MSAQLKLSMPPEWNEIDRAQVHGSVGITVQSSNDKQEVSTLLAHVQVEHINTYASADQRVQRPKED